jgi:hypothetical protein
MSALSSYITQVQRLLHDSSAQFWSTSEITDYINSARLRTVRDTGCYRNLQNIYLSPGVEVYPFGGVTGFNITNAGSGYTSAPTVTVGISSATGAVRATATATVTAGKITSISTTLPGTLYSSTPSVTITGGGGSSGAATAYYIDCNTIDCVNFTAYWGNSRYILGYRDWSTFNALARQYVNYQGIPSLFSVYSYTSVYLARIPDQNYQSDFDSVMQPPLLVDNTTLEVIPIVMQDPVQYFAAHLAKIKSQRWDEADMFYKRYNVEIQKAINSSFTRRLKYPYANQS